MTYEELLQLFSRKAPQAKRAKPRDLEHQLQCACVHWYRFAYARFSDLLFAIPNGGRRDVVTGRKLKDEGVLAGVADLFLAIPNREYHGLFIEMKTDKGRQSEAQKNFQRAVTGAGYNYAICRSKEDFSAVVTSYLHRVRLIPISHNQ